MLKELGIPKLWVPQELEVEVGLNYGDAIPLREHSPRTIVDTVRWVGVRKNG